MLRHHSVITPSSLHHHAVIPFRQGEHEEAQEELAEHKTALANTQENLATSQKNLASTSEAPPSPHHFHDQH